MQPPAIGENELDIVGILDHVVVGEDIALAADDHPRSQAGRAARLVFA